MLPICAKELLAVMSLAQKPREKKRYAWKDENQDQTKEKRSMRSRGCQGLSAEYQKVQKIVASYKRTIGCREVNRWSFACCSSRSPREEEKKDRKREKERERRSSCSSSSRPRSSTIF